MIKYPQIFAHRGASGTITENTYAAMQRAHADGASWVEFDVMLTNCGTPVVFHDENCLRLCSKDLAMATLDYLAVMSLRVNNGLDADHHVIPHFSEMLTYLADLSLGANIEIKPLPHQDVATAECVWQETKAHYQQRPQHFIFSSFSVLALETLRALAPDASIALLLHEWSPTWQEIAERLNVIALHLNVVIATPDRIQQIRTAGYQLAVYTVNERETAEKLWQQGVNAVFTDFPDQLRSSP